MKYHQFLSKLSKDQQCKILDWAINNASTFSLVWRDDFEFKKSAKKIERKLKEFLERTDLTNKWPGTEVLAPPSTKIHFYKITNQSSKILTEFGPIFKWLAPKYPEDLAFYNNKQKPILGSVAHEKILFIIGKKKAVKEVQRIIGDVEIITLNI